LKRPFDRQSTQRTTGFVHLIKLTDKFGKGPKNRRMTIEQIQSGRITLNPGRLQIATVLWPKTASGPPKAARSSPIQTQAGVLQTLLCE
jgi:hypothetical protein